MGKKKTAKPTADIAMKAWVAAVLCIILVILEMAITLNRNTFLGDLDIIPDIILTVLWCYVCNTLFKRGIMSKGLGIMIIFSSFLNVVSDIMIFDEYLEDIGVTISLIALILWLITRIMMICKYSGFMKKYATYDLIFSLALSIIEIYLLLSDSEFGVEYGNGRWLSYLAIIFIIMPYNYMYNMLIEGNEDATFIQII